jgi:hypothetical protein
VKKFSFLSPLVLFALIFIIAWFGIMVWAKGPNVFKWTVQVTRDNGLTDEERAYQCLGIWTKLFDNDPMAKKWASDWNTRNVEFFWYEKEDLWAIFDDAIADAIVAYNNDTQSADVFLIIIGTARLG